MSFRDKAEGAGIGECYREGLQALRRRDRRLVECADTRKIEGSVFIEKCVAEGRWDYAIGYDNKVYFLEVHPADTTKRFYEVWEKALWLYNWKLNTPFKGDNSLFWVATGKILANYSRGPASKMKAKMQKELNLFGPIKKLQLPS